MNETEKTIKYIAIAFAVVLGLAIFYLIINILFNIVTSFGIFEEEYEENTDYTSNTYEIIPEYIDINLNATNLTIELGDALTIKTNNNKLKIEAKDNKLIIADSKEKRFNQKHLKELTITLPREAGYATESSRYSMISKLSVNAGAGSVSIDNVITNDLKLNLGAGSTDIKNIKANIAKIEAGAGSVSLKSVELNNLNLDLGVGEIKLSGTITGSSRIDSGIGEVNLDLDLSKEDYTFEFKKGLGTIHLDEQNISDDTIIGNGHNNLEINGGIGNITIKTNRKGE